MRADVINNRSCGFEPPFLLYTICRRPAFSFDSVLFELVVWHEGLKMSKKQYVIVREGNRMLPRKDAPADPLFMMDPEEVRYKEEFLCRKYVILDRVVSFDQSRGGIVGRQVECIMTSRSRIEQSLQPLVDMTC